MKRMALVIGAVLAIFFLVVSSASATTWYTYREDVTISTGYCDISNVIILDNNPAWTNTTGNISLPCNIGNLTDMNFSVYNVTGADSGSLNGGGQSYNLTVNGIDVNNSGWINSSNQINWTTLVHYTAQGGSQTAKYINWTVDSSFQVILNLTITATDASLSSTYLTNNLTIKERDVTIPTVGTSQPASYWTVNNSINVTTNPYLFNLSELTFNLTYADHTIGTPGISTVTIATLAVNGTGPATGAPENYTQYQKRGPYVYNVDGEISGRTHEVTIKLGCPELLTNVVEWSINPNADKYDGAFDTLDYNTLDIEQNGVGRDWEEGSIELEDFTVFSSIFNNRWVFTWTEPSAVPPTPPDLWDGFVDWMNDDSIGIPNWLGILVVIAVIALLVIVYSYYRKK